MSGRIRTYHELSGEDASDLGGQVREQTARVRRRLEAVERVVAVASGKGGVGKSLVTAALAAAAARAGRRVALLDADLDGPTAHRFLGVRGGELRVEEGSVAPAAGREGVALLSMGLLLDEGAPLRWRAPDAHAFVWRGARERGALREFLSDVAWGRRDLLLVDLPPGSGRLLDLQELVPDLAGVVGVTIPTDAARSSVERTLELCREREVRILGLVENMAGYRCPACGVTGPLFPGSAGRELSRRFRAPLLGRVPFDPEAAAAADRGDPGALLRETGAGAALAGAAGRLLEALEAGGGTAGDGGADAGKGGRPDPDGPGSGGTERRPVDAGEEET